MRAERWPRQGRHFFAASFAPGCCEPATGGGGRLPATFSPPAREVNRLTVALAQRALDCTDTMPQPAICTARYTAPDRPGGDAMAETTSAFISYAHQDTIIANEIERQLTFLAGRGKGKGFLKCFLDTKSIPAGQKYEPIIKSALEQADWLIVVFTGDQSVYCGFEIGIYSVMRPHDDKPVMCLHDLDKSALPAVLDGYKTAMVAQVAPYLASDPMPTGEDVKLWWESAIGRFLHDFCHSKDLYTANDCENPGEYSVDIAKAAKSICHAFEMARQDDEKEETPVQAAF